MMRLTDFVIEIGYRLLSQGAEIHRVEDTIERISAAYGFWADVFAIPGSIIVTLTDAEGKTFSKTRRVRSIETNLDRVDALNALARFVCAECPDEQTLRNRLDEIENRPRYSKTTRLFVSGGIAAAFSVLFGGGIFELLVAFLTGCLVHLTVRSISLIKGNVLLTNIAGGACCTLVPNLMLLFFPYHIDAATSGAMMLLVPGMLMANSMRDIIAGDLVTGVMKATEALLIATGIAVGTMGSLSLWNSLIGGMI